VSMTRAAVLTASQCATYDEVKHAWMAATGAADGLATHFAASMLTAWPSQHSRVLQMAVANS